MFWLKIYFFLALECSPAPFHDVADIKKEATHTYRILNKSQTLGTIVKFAPLYTVLHKQNARPPTPGKQWSHQLQSSFILFVVTVLLLHSCTVITCFNACVLSVRVYTCVLAAGYINYSAC